MSGHSKWAQIKRQKGVTDQKRGQVFTKLANAITIAVREGGGVVDPNFNFKLRLVIDKARAANMPKENIARAIDRGSGKGGEAAFEEVLYEGFAPGGIALLIEAATDNKLRTNAEVRNVVEKNGGSMGQSGAVSYLFEQKGLIVVKKNKSFDDIFLIAVDSGAEDVEDGGDEVYIYTKPQQVSDIKNKLLDAGCDVISFEQVRKPLTTIVVDNKEAAKKIIALCEKIEELDDVQKVYSNFDIPESVLTE